MKQHLQRNWRFAMTLLIGLIANLLAAPLALPLAAHGGGTPRLTNEPVGPYRLYAWSEPEPWRVGEVHLSLAVTKLNPDSASNQVEIPVTDVQVTVTYRPMQDNVVDPTQSPLVVQAVRQEFLSDFYYEADPTLTRVGDWQIQVDVTGADGSGRTQFAMETLPERSLNWTLIGSAGGVLVVVLALIAIWSRSQQPAQPVQPPHRGVRRTLRPSGKRATSTDIRKEA